LNSGHLTSSNSWSHAMSHYASSSSNLAWFQSLNALVTCLLNSLTIFTDACSSWTKCCVADIASSTFSPHAILSLSSVGVVPQCRDSSLYRCIQNISHNLILAPTAMWPYLHFCIFMHFAYFMFSHFHALRVFRALTCTITCLPRIHCIPFTCPVLILQGPLVHILLYFTHIILCVFAFPFMFTYLVICLYYITLVCLALPTWFRALGTCLAC
jgi:hypothetical protein